MWSASIAGKPEGVLAILAEDKYLGPYVDASLPIPKPHRGQSPIRLVVIGQDPTVRDASKRREITTVLNLDRNGSVRAYLSRVADGLGIDLNQVYATNLYKNFFVSPPTSIGEIDVFSAFSGAWLPLLIEELAEFPEAPVISLGQPLLETLVCLGAPSQVRHYWGYVRDWQAGNFLPFNQVASGLNRLSRLLFPFPHQPSLRKAFYRARLMCYVHHVRQVAFARDGETTACHD